MDLFDVFQFRKFAYENLLKYLDNGSLEVLNDGMGWLDSAKHTQLEMTVKIETIKVEVDEIAAFQTTGEEKSTETDSTNVIKYNIIYTIDNARFDGGTRYYLLIKPIDLSNDNFKDGIKGIVIRFVKKHGNKVSLNIYDKLETLKNDYKDSETFNTPQSTDPEFLKDLDLHLIAYYDGDLSTGPYLNTLWFFPTNYYENQSIEKYMEILEFNP
jgi:hypothetical protein